MSVPSGVVVNQEQAAAWGGDEGHHWVQYHDRYDTMLRDITPHLLHAALAANPRAILDVGCGCGQTSLMAGQANRNRSVLGVDLSAPMLAVARQRAAGDDLTNVEFIQADAQTRPFARDSFDVVMSRFGIMFFSEPLEAFENLRGALRPSGRLAFVCWQAATDNEWLMVPGGAVARYVNVAEAFGAGGPGPFSFADPERIETILAEAGYDHIQIDPVREKLWLGDDVEGVIELFSDMPNVKSMLAGLTPQHTAQGFDSLRTALSPFETKDGVLLGSAAWLVTAAKR